MRDITEMPIETAANISVVLADIDDTLTSNGRLVTVAFQALEKLHHAGVWVGVVTGRPAGWCDLIARQWPVDGVVGENGAFYYRYDLQTRTMHREYMLDEVERSHNRQTYDVIAKTIVKEVPGCAISSDQSFRIADLAVDFCEDVPPLSSVEVQKIQRIFTRFGAKSKISSIHVNGWFGSYDKLTMTKRMLRDCRAIDINSEIGRVVFCGDSPNDAPMFGYFPNACGVANVREYASEIDTLPRYVTQSKGGKGFHELSKYLLQSRKQLVAIPATGTAV